MKTFHRRPAAPPRPGLVVALLLLALGLAGVLTFEAQRAARSHREAAERTVRDYAFFSAFQFARHAKQGIYSAVWAELGPAEMVHPEKPLPPPGFVVKGREERCRSCYAVASVRSWFRVDLRAGSFATTDPSPRPEVYRWLADTLSRTHTIEGEPSFTGALVADVGGRSRAFGYMVRVDSAGKPLFAYGFETDPAALGAVFGRVLERMPLLPPTLMDGAPNDSMVSVTVMDPAGRVVYRSRASYPATFAEKDTIGVRYGGLTGRVALRPSAAERMVIGGLPRSRLPLLLGLLGLTAGLIAVAVVQLRRQSELARLRSDFVSGVSHELRTPLAQIRMFAETLLLGRVRSEEEANRSLRIIDQEARRLTHLVENVLLFSRSERRATHVCPVPTEVAPEVREALEGFAPVARARQTELHAELEEGVTATVDRGALRQMLLNLVDNALKYGPAGQTVTVAMEAAGGWVRIRVDDQGPGIPVAERRRIWEPYRRLARDTEGAVGGSGIGLAVVAELVELHGGRAGVEDAPGGGARFVLELPGAERTPGRGDGAAGDPGEGAAA